MRSSRRPGSEPAQIQREGPLLLALAGAGLAAWDWDVRADTITWTGPLYDLLGVELADAPRTYAAFFPHIHPDDRERVDRGVRDALAAGGAYTVDYRVHPERGERWLRASGRVYPDQAGEGARMIGVLRDITAERRAEQILRDSEERYRTMAESLPTNLLVATRKGRILYANRRLLEYTGVTLEELREWTTNGIVHPDDVDVLANAWRRSTERGVPFSTEYRLRRHDGVYRWQEVEAAPARFVRGETERWITVTLDRDDRHREQEALRVNEERLRLAMKQFPVVLFEQDRDLRYRWAANVTPPFDETNVIGQTDDDLFSPHDARMLNEFKRAVIETGRPARHEMSVQIAGERYTFDVTAQPSRDAQGAITGVTCAALDITEPKRALEALERSEERLRVAIQAAPMFVFEHDSELHYTWVSELGPGFTEETVLGQTDAAAFAPEDASRIMALKRKAIEQCVRVREEMTVDFGGERRTFDLTVEPWRDRKGAIAGVVGVAFDVTERKQIEDALRASEELLRSTIESTADGILVIDSNGRMVHANARFAEMWRIPEDIVATKDDERLLSFVLDQLVEPEAFLAKVRELYQTDREDLDVVEFRDGRSFERYSRPLVSDATITGRVWSFRDITQRKQIEDALRAANKTKDEFLGMVSHELRTPITVIMGTSEVLVRTGETLSAETRRRALQDIRDEADRLHRVIDDLLVVARLEQGAEVHREPVLILPMVQRVVEDRRSRYPAREVVVRCGAVLPLVEAAPMHIEQVLRNLLSNAEKYSPPETPIMVTVSGREGEVVVCVEDRGTGVLASERPYVFEPFFRSARVSAAVPGVGIGLSVCKRLVEAQGGRIWLEDAEPRGSRFCFSLPVLREENAAGQGR